MQTQDETQIAPMAVPVRLLENLIIYLSDRGEVAEDLRKGILNLKTLDIDSIVSTEIEKRKEAELMMSESSNGGNK